MQQGLRAMQQGVEDERCLVAGLVACMQQGVEDERCLVAGLVACMQQGVEDERSKNGLSGRHLTRQTSH